MAYEIERINNTIPQGKQEETPWETIKRNVSSSTSRFFESLAAPRPPLPGEAMFEWEVGKKPQIYLGEAVRQSPLYKSTQPSFEVKPYEQPRSGTEEFVQRFLSQSPYALTAGLSGGGGLLAASDALKRLGIGSAASGLAHFMGAPEWAKDLSQFGAELGYGFLTRPGFEESLKKQRTEAYKPINPIKKYGSVSTEPMKEPLKAIGYAFDLATDEAEKKKLGVFANTMDKYFGGENVDIKDAWEVRKNLYKQSGKASGKIKELINMVTPEINKVLEQSAQVNPEFWDSLKKGDQLHIIKNMGNVIGEFTEKYLKPKSIPGYLKSPLYLIGKIGEGVEFSYKTLKNPQTRAIWNNLALAAANESPSDFLKYAKMMPTNGKSLSGKYEIERSA